MRRMLLTVYHSLSLHVDDSGKAFLTRFTNFLHIFAYFFIAIHCFITVF